LNSTAWRVAFRAAGAFPGVLFFVAFFRALAAIVFSGEVPAELFLHTIAGLRENRRMSPAERRSRRNDDAAISAEAEQARFRLEVMRQRERLTREALQRARALYKEARKEARRARKKAASARRKWRSMRKGMSRGEARAVKRKARRSVLRTPSRPVRKRDGR
jgi:hypothetical protein